MSDVGGSKLDKYIITETSGKPDNNSNWIDIRDASNMKVSKATVKFKVDYPSTLEEKKYYVHVLDTANQYSSQSFKASIYHTLTLNYNYSGRANDNQIVKMVKRLIYHPQREMVIHFKVGIRILNLLKVAKLIQATEYVLVTI